MLLFRSSSQLKAIKTLRDNGAIVQVSERHPWWLGPLKRLDWGNVFIAPAHVEMYVQIEGGRVRVKDRLYEPDDAKRYLMQQKTIAVEHGATSFQLRAAAKLGDTQEQEIRHQFMVLAMNNLDSGMTYDWSVYRSDWEKQQLSTR